MKSRGDEENCRAVANRLHKIRRALAWRIPPNPAPGHAILRSNASFETKHRPPAVFQELPSWLQRVAQRTCLCENKIARARGCTGQRRPPKDDATEFLLSRSLG